MLTCLDVSVNASKKFQVFLFSITTKNNRPDFQQTIDENWHSVTLSSLFDCRLLVRNVFQDRATAMKWNLGWCEVDDCYIARFVYPLWTGVVCPPPPPLPRTTSICQNKIATSFAQLALVSVFLLENCLMFARITDRKFHQTCLSRCFIPREFRQAVIWVVSVTSHTQLWCWGMGDNQSAITDSWFWPPWSRLSHCLILVRGGGSETTPHWSDLTVGFGQPHTNRVDLRVVLSSPFQKRRTAWLWS